MQKVYEKNVGFKRHNFLMDIIACPICKGPVELNDTKVNIICPTCQKNYTIENNVPIMIDENEIDKVDKGLKADQESKRMFRSFTNKQSKIEKIYRAIQPPKQPYFGIRKEKRIAHLIDQTVNIGKAVEIGSGTTRTDERIINVDISTFFNVDIVGVGGKLPFLDNSLGLVVSQAVLEHVPDSNLVVNEMYRVLKPGGYVFAEVPGVVPYHGFPSHYRNYTLEGLHELFKKFKIIDDGTVFGPSSALAWLIKEYIGLFWGNLYLRAIIHTITEWILHPLNYIDYFMNKNSRAHRMAMTLYIICKKEA